MIIKVHDNIHLTYIANSNNIIIDVLWYSYNIILIRYNMVETY